MSNKTTEQIHSSSDYDKFEFVESNRPINYGKVNRLRKEMDRKYLGNEFPITVQKKGSKLVILDGQHRFVSAQIDGRKIYYIVTDDMEIEDIARVNSSQDKWKLIDYLNHYAKEDRHAYKAFKGYMERHGFGPSITMAILLGQRWGPTRTMFINGLLDINDVEWVWAERFAEKIHDFSDYVAFNKHRDFIAGLLYIVKDHKDKYDHDKMMAKMEYASVMLKKQPDTKSYVAIFEEIYNYKSRGRRVHFD